MESEKDWSIVYADEIILLFFSPFSFFFTFFSLFPPFFLSLSFCPFSPPFSPLSPFLFFSPDWADDKETGQSCSGGAVLFHGCAVLT